MVYPIDPKKLGEAKESIEAANKASAEARRLEQEADEAARDARDARTIEQAHHRIADHRLGDAGVGPVNPLDHDPVLDPSIGGPARAPFEPAAVAPEVVERPIYKHPAALVVGIVALVLAAVALVLCFINVTNGGKDEVARATSDSSAKIINEHSRSLGKLEGRMDAKDKTDAETRTIANQALTTSTEAKAAASAVSTCNACCKTCPLVPPRKHTHKVQPKQHAIITEPRESHPAPGPRVVTPPIWLWHDPYATAEHPKPCVVESGNGAGLPPYCSSFTVNGRHPGESKHEWLLRVGGGVDPTDTGLYHKSNKST